MFTMKNFFTRKNLLKDLEEYDIEQLQKRFFKTNK